MRTGFVLFKGFLPPQVCVLFWMIVVSTFTFSSRVYAQPNSTQILLEDRQVAISSGPFAGSMLDSWSLQNNGMTAPVSNWMVERYLQGHQERRSELEPDAAAIGSIQDFNSLVLSKEGYYRGTVMSISPRSYEIRLSNEAHSVIKVAAEKLLSDEITGSLDSQVHGVSGSKVAVGDEILIKAYLFNSLNINQLELIPSYQSGAVLLKAGPSKLASFSTSVRKDEREKLLIKILEISKTTKEVKQLRVLIGKALHENCEYSIWKQIIEVYNTLNDADKNILISNDYFEHDLARFGMKRISYFSQEELVDYIQKNLKGMARTLDPMTQAWIFEKVIQERLLMLLDNTAQASLLKMKILNIHELWLEGLIDAYLGKHWVATEKPSDFRWAVRKVRESLFSMRDSSLRSEVVRIQKQALAHFRAIEKYWIPASELAEFQDDFSDSFERDIELIEGTHLRKIAKLFSPRNCEEIAKGPPSLKDRINQQFDLNE